MRGKMTRAASHDKGCPCFDALTDFHPMPFPTLRPRRLRATAAMRRLVRETSLAPGDFIWPLFFSATLNAPKPVGTMPGVLQWPVSSAAKVARDAASHGLGAVLLFGLPGTKDARGTSALDPDG